MYYYKLNVTVNWNVGPTFNISHFLEKAKTYLSSLLKCFWAQSIWKKKEQHKQQQNRLNVAYMSKDKQYECLPRCPANYNYSFSQMTNFQALGHMTKYRDESIKSWDAHGAKQPKVLRVSEHW